MSNGPAPTLVNDWFTTPFVTGAVFLTLFVWLTVLILRHVEADEPPVSFPVSPCAVLSHQYRSQPVVWRCVRCGDERVAEEVYDQTYA